MAHDTPAAGTGTNRHLQSFLLRGGEEAWEGEDGWHFDDLCAVVACVIDHEIVAPAEHAAAGRMLARHTDQIPKIIALASPPLVTKTDATAIGEAVQGVLILGLGTPGFPFKLSDKQTTHGAAESVLAKLLGVEESKIPVRCFERARTKVQERYTEHCARMKLREDHEHGGSLLPEVLNARIRLKLMTRCACRESVALRPRCGGPRVEVHHGRRSSMRAPFRIPRNHKMIPIEELVEEWEPSRGGRGGSVGSRVEPLPSTPSTSPPVPGARTRTDADTPDETKAVGPRVIDAGDAKVRAGGKGKTTSRGTTTARAASGNGAKRDVFAEANAVYTIPDLWQAFIRATRQRTWAGWPALPCAGAHKDLEPVRFLGEDHGMIRTWLCGGWCLLALTLQPLHGAPRTWTNTEGLKIEAHFVKADGDQVTLRLLNGKEVTFAQDKLCAQDREFIRSAPEAKPPPTGGSKSPSESGSRTARWQTTMNRAKQEAKKTGLPILVLFTASTWSPNCIKLEQELLAQQEFKEFANKNLVLLMLDFEVGGTCKSRDGDDLAKTFGVTDYPTYILTDAEGKSLASGGYQKGITPESFAEWVKKAAK